MPRTVTVNPGYVSALTLDGEVITIDGDPVTSTGDAVHSTSVTVIAGRSTDVTVEDS